MMNCVYPLSRLLGLVAIAQLFCNGFGFAPVHPGNAKKISPLHSDMGDGASSGGGVGRVEQVEFKIYPDGSVEETVRGIKGSNCHKVTEKINEALGEVIASSPTEELFEQELLVEQTITENVGDSSSEWDGKSSW